MVLFFRRLFSDIGEGSPRITFLSDLGRSFALCQEECPSFCLIGQPQVGPIRPLRLDLRFYPLCHRSIGRSLLTALAQKCPQIDKDFAYCKQTYNGDFKKIGSVFTDLYREWAWSKGN
ncbi:hypothetical protein OEJ37_12905 [Burkholderia sp. BKH01]|uniref:hypothetical protein n=1 Tax=Burkholderia sp. BKH01 TaxID=2769262 RepID=UPI0021E03E23|nr:hypothetical protein [Burkholderia sp. BKH01]MCU9954253.1 hypothetical protein [Burkholderia sp. BKH01]